MVYKCGVLIYNTTIKSKKKLQPAQHPVRADKGLYAYANQNQQISGPIARKLCSRDAEGLLYARS